MTDKDQEFMEHLLATFRVEAADHLRDISSGLIELEKAGAPERRHEIVEELFREVHSLKGAARSVGLTDVEAFCQAMESLFAALKRGEIRFSSGLFDLLHESVDFLGPLLSPAVDGQGDERESRQTELILKLEKASRNETGSAGTESCETAKGGSAEADIGEVNSPAPQLLAPPVQDASHAATETIRVSAAKLGSVLLQSEEMLSAKIAALQRAAQMREMKAAFHAWKKEWTRLLPELRRIRLQADKALSGDANANAETNRGLEKVLEFLQWNGDFIRTMERRHAAEAKTAGRDSLSLDGKVNSLMEEMRKLLMFPCSSLLESFPKIVRDLSRDYGKKADFVALGGDIEIDRRILEEMKDPLMHMVRNCIDHGIEKPDERKRKNKPERGTITVAVSPKDDKVEVIVADDGAGIAFDRVRSAVKRLGMGEEAGRLTDRELMPYVFKSGISTSPIITELSGRGLGLSIVREKVEKLGGTVSLETAADTGTSFRIVIPLTIATFRGILLRVAERVFVVPAMHVKRALRLKREEIGTVEGRETMGMNGQTLSLTRLTDVLGVTTGKKVSDAGFLQAIVLEAAGTSIAFLVDEVLREQEVLIKPLGRQLSRVANVAGATVLGSGELAPVLNVPDLLKSAVKLSAGVLPSGGPAEAEGAVAGKRAILIVEDSITTRTLLRNMLEAVGFDVATAVDGVDAFIKLKGAEFDLVVSDVDMPRMNGFDLTAKIRADRKMGELPVVLVTALESREDRERGIDVGANAYIVKSSFDQGNLLEVIKRLL